MSEGFDQRRRFPRIRSEHAVLVKRLTAEEVEGFAKTQTVGLGGCMFVSPDSLGIGSPVELLISLPGWIFKAQGKVVYENPREGDGTEVGVEFVSISDDDRKILEGLVGSSSDPGV